MNELHSISAISQSRRSNFHRVLVCLSLPPTLKVSTTRLTVQRSERERTEKKLGAIHLRLDKTFGLEMLSLRQVVLKKLNNCNR